LADAASAFATKCIVGISANREVCAGFIEKSLALVTGLVPRLGYDRAAEVAQKAYATGKTVREVLTEDRLLSKEEMDALLEP
jgi:fumarate hydratase class II